MSHDRGCYCGREKYDSEDCDRLDCKYREKPMKLNEDDDFGFTFTDSSEIQTKVAATEDKLAGLRKMIMPLLKNLMKNPEKDTIVWPNRKQKIEEFIKKMDDYING